MSDPNMSLLQEAAVKLAPFLEEVVFVGGITLGLLITDKGAAPIRGTIDVDIIAEILTYTDYIAFSERMRAANFSEDQSELLLTCRWRNQSLIVDVLPIDKKALGFTNIWYRGALKTAVAIILPGGQTIRIISAPFFRATKMEAFRQRGDRDYFASHDLEDVIAVIDGRNSILDEISSAPSDLRIYLAGAAKGLLRDPRFLDALPGFVLGDEASQQRVPLIHRRLIDLTQLA